MNTSESLINMKWTLRQKTEALNKFYETYDKLKYFSKI